ncbi:MAG TPA: hypothetical protein VEP73_10270, partial [Actinomycetota bacterium]|nr:hypothetical protein [Actinomycetota bacterium]
MSAMLLVAGATALAGAVFAALFSVQSLVVERRQSYRTIRALRAIDLKPTDIRNRELAEPARNRVWAPLYRAALAVARRLTPLGAKQNIQ